MRKPKPQPQFTLLVQHTDIPAKAIGFWTAKAARLRAKQLAGVKSVIEIELHHDGHIALLWDKEMGR